jgi:hypothetical protein
MLPKKSAMPRLYSGRFFGGRGFFYGFFGSFGRQIEAAPAEEAA